MRWRAGTCGHAQVAGDEECFMVVECSQEMAAILLTKPNTTQPNLSANRRNDNQERDIAV